MRFFIYVISFVISPHMLIILFIWVFSLLFLVSLGKDLLIFVHFFKESGLSFVNLFYFLFSIWFISAQVFISFLLLTLGFICYFSNWTGPPAILQFFHLYLIPIGQALQIPPVICRRRDPSGPPSKCLTMWMRLNAHLGFFLSYWSNCRLGSPL